MSNLYKIGSCSSTIQAGPQTVKKRLILNSFEEAEAIERGVDIINKNIDSSVCLPIHIAFTKAAQENEDLLILEYEQIRISPWICYSWITSQQLYELGLLILEQQYVLQSNNLTFVDARPSNYSLFGPHLLVDLGSIKPLTKQNFYSFQADFSNHFITPLLLEKKLNIPVNQYFKGNLESCNIDTLRIASTLMSRSFFISNIAKSLFYMVSHKISNSSPQFIEYLLSRQSNSGLISINAANKMTKKLGKLLAFTKPKLAFSSSWNQYSNFHDDTYSHRKLNLINSFLSSLDHPLAIDLGSNTGTANISNIIGFVDKDIVVCNELRRKLSMNQAVICTNIAQDLLDVANGNNESCLNLSGHANTAIATSLLHHIIIDAGLPAECFYSSLSRLFETVLLEFITADDIMIKFLKHKKNENFVWSWNQHLQICAKTFSVSSPTELSPTRFAVVLSRIN